MNKLSKARTVIATLLMIYSFTSFAQQQSVENALLWEVTGNGLKESSYLFGTMHLLGGDFVDSLGNVINKFHKSKAFVGEILMDSSQFGKIFAAALMKDSSLQQLLLPQDYDSLQLWMEKLTGYTSLAAFEHLNPLTLKVMLFQFIQTELYGEVKSPVDMYLQYRAKATGKKVFALETLDEQLDAMFKGTTYRRQAELLAEMVRTKSTVREEIIRFNTLYRQQNLSALEALTLEELRPEELEVTLHKRNRKWMSSLPGILNTQSTFVAVGTMHLTGETGLVTQLRKLGYTVTPISLHR